MLGIFAVQIVPALLQPFRGLRLRARFRPILSHGIALHLNTVSIMNQSVQDAVGKRRIADLFVPARNRQLRCEDGRAYLIAVLANLPEVAALGF